MNQLEYEICLRVYRGENDIEYHSTPEENAILAACRRKHWLHVSDTGIHTVTQLGKAELLSYHDGLLEKKYQEYLNGEEERRLIELAPGKDRKQFRRDLIIASLGGVISGSVILIIQNFGKVVDFLKKIIDSFH